MNRLFLSHSSKNNKEAIALKDWLKEEGWDDVFLDLDPNTGIAPGQRWLDALHESANHCEAVLFLVSRDWLASDWCEREFDLAQNLNKRCFGIMIDDLGIDDIPLKYRKDFQLVNLRQGIDHGTPRKVRFDDGQQEYVTFSQAGLARLKNGLNTAGLDPRFFPWPPKHDPNRSPYQGLRALDIDDAGIFFGRDAHTIDLLDQLRGLHKQPGLHWLVILGPSGCGKSSFLRAGLWPRLKRDDTTFYPLPILRPEDSPLLGEDSGLLGVLKKACATLKLERSRAQIREALASVETLVELLANIAQAAKVPPLPDDASHQQNQRPTRLVLMIDQAEELFFTGSTSEAPTETDQLLSLLVGLAKRKTSDKTRPVEVLVLCTLRSDAYEPMQTCSILEPIKQHTFSLPPLAKGAYHQVIEGPVRVKRAAQHQSKLELEPQLIQALLDDIDANDSKDALPLLAFTLERLLKEYGTGGTLKLADYKNMSRLEGAIKAAVKDALQHAKQDPSIPSDDASCLALVRQGMIPWLVGIDPTRQQARRKVALFSQIPLASQPLIQALVNGRLFVSEGQANGETSVEIAHDSLLNDWPDLQLWLKEDLDALTRLEHLQRDSRNWADNQQDANWLNHHAGRLSDAEDLTNKDEFAQSLNQTDKEYLTACREQENAQKDKELNAQKQITRRTQMGLGVAVVLLVISTGIGFYAFQKQQEAETSLTKANSFLYSIQKSMHFLNFQVRDALQHYAPSSVRIPVMEELDRISELLNQHGVSDFESERQRMTALIQKADLILQNSQLDPVEAKALLEQAVQIAQRLVEQVPGNTEFLRNLSVALVNLGDTQKELGNSKVALEHYESSLEIFKRLANSDPDNLGADHDLWMSFLKVGNIQLRLGHTEVALSHYQSSLEIAQQLVKQDPDNTGFQRGLSVSFEKLGDIQFRLGHTEVVLEYYQSSLKIRQQLVKKDPDNTQFQRDLSVSLGILGDIQRRLGRTAVALGRYQSSLEAVRQLVKQDPDNTELQRELSISLNKLGDVQMQIGNIEAALEHYQSGLEIFKRLVKQNLNNAEFRSNLSVSYERLGDIQLKIGNTEAALEHYQSSLEILQQLVKLDPNDTGFQNNLAVSFSKLGDIQLRLGNTKVAFEHHQSSLELGQRLVILSPDNTSFQRNLSQFYERLGDVMLRLGNTQTALKHHHSSLKIRQQLANQDSENTVFQRNLSVSLIKLGDIQVRLGNTKVALEYYQSSLEIFKRLVALDLDNAEFQRDLLASLLELGDIQLRLGNTEATLGYYQSSLEIAQQLVKQDPDNTEFQQGMSVVFEKLGDIQLKLGHTEMALGHYQSSLGIRQQLVEQDPDNTGFQRGLSISLGKLGGIQLKLGNTEVALGYYQSSLEIRQQLVKQDPDNTQFQRDLSVPLERLGDIRLRLGHTEEALGHYQSSLEIRETLVKQDPDNTGFQRGLFVSFYKLSRVAPDSQQQQTWLQKALDKLLEMKAKGILAVDDEQHIAFLEGEIAKLAVE